MALTGTGVMMTKQAVGPFSLLPLLTSRACQTNDLLEKFSLQPYNLCTFTAKVEGK